METCAKCRITQHKDIGQAKVPNKVLHHFPFIPRLKLMFKAHVLLYLMVWHNNIKNIDGLVRHVVDNKTWAHIDARWLEFVVEPRNVKLGLVTYGVNPFSEKSYN